MEERKEMEEKRRKSISIKDLERTTRKILSEEDLKPYKDLGNGLYELPGNVIANRKGLDKYLKKFKKEQQYETYQI